MSAVVRIHHVSIPMPPGGNEKARHFYGGLLGLEEKPVPSSLDSRKIVWFDLGSGGDELHVFSEDVGGSSEGQHLCIQVEDIAAWREMLASRGVTIEETTTITNRPRFVMRDPFGNLLEVTQVLGDYQAPAVDHPAQ